MMIFAHREVEKKEEPDATQARSWEETMLDWREFREFSNLSCMRLEAERASSWRHDCIMGCRGQRRRWESRGGEGVVVAAVRVKGMGGEVAGKA